jgi:hypothetical protein
MVNACPPLGGESRLKPYFAFGFERFACSFQKKQIFDYRKLYRPQHETDSWFNSCSSLTDLYHSL